MAEMKMNIKFDYDKEADVLYITLGTGEPSYCEEIDDILLVERGFITNNITGFRVLDVKHHGIKAVEIRVFRVLKQEKPPLWVPYFGALKERLESEQLKNMISA